MQIKKKSECEAVLKEQRETIRTSKAEEQRVSRLNSAQSEQVCVCVCVCLHVPLVVCDSGGDAAELKWE